MGCWPPSMAFVLYLLVFLSSYSLSLIWLLSKPFEPFVGCVVPAMVYWEGPVED